jgi:hypothetical protein
LKQLRQHSASYYSSQTLPTNNLKAALKNENAETPLNSILKPKKIFSSNNASSIDDQNNYSNNINLVKTNNFKFIANSSSNNVFHSKNKSNYNFQNYSVNSVQYKQEKVQQNDKKLSSLW